MYGSADQFRYQQRERVRAFARERFFAFYRRMFPTLAPEATFSGALHFRVLARALERVANVETRRLLIAIPPRHGKSLFTSVAFPAWILGRDPTRKVICASYGDQLSKDFSNRFRDLIWSARLSGSVPRQDRHRGERLFTFGSATELERVPPRHHSPRASHWQGAHVIIVDDPFKAAEAASDLGPPTPSTTGSRAR